ncbi:MAG: hypothetical protein FJZ56_02090 [Chlamydiae bacterium]|nr:hypothetical protein [Chlamydiota bacterium]
MRKAEECRFCQEEECLVSDCYNSQMDVEMLKLNNFKSCTSQGYTWRQSCQYKSSQVSCGKCVSPKCTNGSTHSYCLYNGELTVYSSAEDCLKQPDHEWLTECKLR